MAVTCEVREPVYPVFPRDSSHETPEAIEQLTTGQFRVNHPGDIAVGSATANAAAALNEWYPQLGALILQWTSRNGALVQREAEAEPLIFPMGRSLFATPPNRVAIVFALNSKNQCAGAAIAKGMARRAAIRAGLHLDDDDEEPRARWMVRTRVDETHVLEQPVSVRSGDSVVLSPGQQIFELHEDGSDQQMSVIWTEHQLYADPTPREESDGELTEGDLAEEEQGEETLTVKE
ncbi:unnamed protein product [Clonostachys solani]|uniref:Uncharacterized protein n=1 Tax=Clonostachys solani TaxID=160281 RepID=A0A9N9YZQ8_9HYPO|nr:unnamed protein product [Clonostachys solani]